MTGKLFRPHFEKSWGIDALIGLDFFRSFRVEINYSKGILISDLFGKGYSNGKKYGSRCGSI